MNLRRLIPVVVSILIHSMGAVAATNLTPPHPDPDTTPGTLCDTYDDDFEEYRYEEEIPYCRRQVSSALKARIYAIYGVPNERRRYYTIDHFIPLSIGGNNQAENLWPEHKKIKALRATLELEVYQDLRDGKISQEQAIQRVIRAKMNPPLISDESAEPIEYKFGIKKAALASGF